MSSLPRVGSAVLIRDDFGRILLGQRNKEPLKGFWVLPGGGVRPFETINQAAIREVFEETGLRIVKVGNRIGVYEIIDDDIEEHRIIIYSYAMVSEGEPKAARDLSDAKFFYPVAFKLGSVDMTPTTTKVLADLEIYGLSTEKTKDSEVDSGDETPTNEESNDQKAD